MILHDHVLANWKHWIGDVFVGPFWTDSSNGQPFFFGLLIQGNGWHVVSPAPDGPRESQCDAETSRESKRPKDTRSDLKSFLKRLKTRLKTKSITIRAHSMRSHPSYWSMPNMSSTGHFHNQCLVSNQMRRGCQRRRLVDSPNKISEDQNRNSTYISYSSKLLTFLRSVVGIFMLAELPDDHERGFFVIPLVFRNSSTAWKVHAEVVSGVGNCGSTPLSFIVVVIDGGIFWLKSQFGDLVFSETPPSLSPSASVSEMLLIHRYLQSPWFGLRRIAYISYLCLLKTWHFRIPNIFAPTRTLLHTYNRHDHHHHDHHHHHHNHHLYLHEGSKSATS